MNYQKLSALLTEIDDLKKNESTKLRIIEHAKSVHPALPVLVESHFWNEHVVGIDKDGRRWVLYGKWILGGMYEMTTIIRETRRKKPFNWLIGGEADKNCKNVWGSQDEEKTRIMFHDLDEKINTKNSILQGR